MNRNRTIHEVAFRLSYDIGEQIAPSLTNLKISLPRQQLRAMRRVWAKGETTLADLCTTLKRDKGQVARIIDELCNADLLVRKPNPRDGRSKLILLTPQGHQFFEAIEEIEAKFSSKLIEGISKEDLEVFFRVSDQLSENIRTLK
ncbi:MAG: MarR family winged helix-turn-helix transcriptional regulator [Chloroflexota bacterium]